MIHYFTYNGRSSLDFGVRISGTGTFGAPEVDYEEITVPGRNGSLLISNHRFKPIRVSYPASIVKNLDSNLSALRAFLLSDFGEHRLTDSYHPDEYRMAAYAGGLEPEVTAGNKAMAAQRTEQYDDSFHSNHFDAHQPDPFFIPPVDYGQRKWRVENRIRHNHDSIQRRHPDHR